MKIGAATWIANLARDAATTLSQLRHKPVEGKALVSKSRQPKPYDSGSLLKRRATVLTDVSSVVNRSANQRTLADLKISLLDTTLRENPHNLSDTELNLAVDLALHKAGLGKISDKGLVSRKLINRRISEEQIKTVQQEFAAIQANPIKITGEALETEALPANFVIALMKAQEARDSATGQSKIVLGDLLAAGADNWSKPAMSRQDFSSLMEEVKKVSTNRHEQPENYLDMISDKCPDTDEKFVVYQFKNLHRIALFEKKRMQPQIGEFFKENACPVKWRATFETMAQTADEQRRAEGLEFKE